MTPASWPAADPAARQLLTAHRGSPSLRLGTVRDLPDELQPGDLLVVNDAATLPASLMTTVDAGAPVEIRLVRPLEADQWLVVLLGTGDWHDDTDDRPPVPELPPGTVFQMGAGLSAELVRYDDPSHRRAVIRFNLQGADFWQALYTQGRPIQYRHVAAPLPLWHVQTCYAARPWTSEMPSAGHPLTWDVLLALFRRGIRVASLTHAAGISATGNRELDETLPWRERYDLPACTVRLIAETRKAGGRVIAVGTSVVRALEGCAAAHDGRLVAGEGETDYRLGPQSICRIVDGLLTGMHEPTASHFQLLQAFAPMEALHQLYAQAAAAGFRSHEFGDLSLIVSPVRHILSAGRHQGALPMAS